MENGTIIALKRNSNETLSIPVRFSIAPHRALQKNILANREKIEEFYSWMAMSETIYLSVNGKYVAKATFDFNAFSGRGNVESVRL